MQVGVPLGLVLANLVFLAISLLGDDRWFIAIGWRIGFLLSVVMILIGVAIQLGTAEPPAEAHEALQPHGGPRAGGRSPLAQAARRHWREILLAGGAFVANNTCFYVAITYAVAYGTASVGISRALMLLAVMIGSV